MIRGRFPTDFFVGAGYATFCGLIVFSMPYAQLFMFSSDQLTVPSFAEDYIINPIFSVTSWMIPRAPYVFPDLIIYATLRLIFRDPYIAIISLLLLYLFFISIAARLILKRAIADPTTAVWSWYSFLTLSALTLISSQGDRLTSLFDSSLTTQLFFPITHGTAAVSAVIAFCFYERVADSRSIAAHFAFLLINALAIFSDKLYFVLFFLPYIFAVLLASPNVNGLRRAIFFALSALLSLVVSFYLDTNFSQQTTDPITFSILERSAVLRNFLLRSPFSFVVLFSVSIPAIYLGVKLLLSLLRSEDTEPSQIRAQAYIILMTGAGLTFGILLWLSNDLANARYMVGMQMGGLLATALLIATSRFKSATRFAVAASLSLTVFIFVASFKPASLSAPFAERTRIINGLNACRDRLGLQGGYAQYWLARKLSVMTDWKFQINQLEPAYPTPFFWGNNISWYYYRLRDGQPLVSNFIIADAFQRNDIISLYGKPSREADCSGLRVLIYDDAADLQLRVSRLLSNRYPLEALTRHFPSDFSLARTLMGSFEITAFKRQVGVIEDGFPAAKAGRDDAGYLMFGPYLTIPTGSYTLEVEYVCRDNTSPNSFDVAGELGSRILERVEIAPRDVRCNGRLQKVVLPFNLDTPAANVEFRGFFGGTGTLNIRSVSLVEASN